MDANAAAQRLNEIDADLDAGRYRKGAWQRFLSDAEALDAAGKAEISDLVSEVSRKLHGRNDFPQVAFVVGFALEVLLLAAGVILVQFDNVFVVLPGVAALVLSLQPTLKIVAGLLLGVRYDYAFLWYFEPRFKMRYGTYFVLDPVLRVIFHIAGSVGTPMAMFVGFMYFLPIDRLMAYVCLVFAAGALAMQVGAFVAEWMGVRNVAGHHLSTLTSPATAAFELKRIMSNAGPR